MDDVINLNRARKAKARATDQKAAAENRAKFGRSKAAKSVATAVRTKAKTLLDQAKREP